MPRPAAGRDPGQLPLQQQQLVPLPLLWPLTESRVVVGRARDDLAFSRAPRRGELSGWCLASRSGFVKLGITALLCMGWRTREMGLDAEGFDCTVDEKLVL